MNMHLLPTTLGNTPVIRWRQTCNWTSHIRRTRSREKLSSRPLDRWNCTATTDDMCPRSNWDQEKIADPCLKWVLLLNLWDLWCFSKFISLQIKNCLLVVDNTKYVFNCQVNICQKQGNILLFEDNFSLFSCIFIRFIKLNEASEQIMLRISEIVEIYCWSQMFIPSKESLWPTDFSTILICFEISTYLHFRSPKPIHPCRCTETLQY